MYTINKRKNFLLINDNTCIYKYNTIMFKENNFYFIF